jgi:hypothetical protein
MAAVTKGWIKDHLTIGTVGRFFQSVLPIHIVLGESWNHDNVHFLITAEELKDPVSANPVEKRDPMPELPLHAMLRRES